MKTKEELKAAEVRFGFSKNFMIQTYCGLAAPFYGFVAVSFSPPESYCTNFVVNFFLSISHTRIRTPRPQTLERTSISFSRNDYFKKSNVIN